MPAIYDEGARHRCDTLGVACLWRRFLGCIIAAKYHNVPLTRPALSKLVHSCAM